MNGIEFEILDAATHTNPWPRSAEDIQAIADSYDPAFHAAPVTLDHVHEGPAYAWVDSLRAAGTKLYATLRDVSAELRAMVNAGKYRNRSVEVAKAGHTMFPDGPFKGKPYLMALTFLGAAWPASKGLAPIPVGFSDMVRRGGDELLFIDFGNPPESGLIFNDRESHNMDPTQRLNELTDQVAGFAAQIQAKDAEIAALKQTADQAAGERDALKAEIEQFKAADAARVAADRKTQSEARVTELVTTGRLLPAQKDTVLASFAALDAAAETALFDALKAGPEVVKLGARHADPPPADKGAEAEASQRFAEARKRAGLE
jgi:regulator of replication initiation timing